MRWNGPTWQAKTIISSFAINSNCVGCKTTVVVFPARHKHVIGANQSASQELPPPQSLLPRFLKRDARKLGTSAKRERGLMGRRKSFPSPSHLSSRALLSRIEEERLGTRQSQECRFATPTQKKRTKKKNSAGLRPGLSNNIKMMKAVRGILESETWNKTETENMPNLFVCFNILLQGHFSCVFKV